MRSSSRALAVTVLALSGLGALRCAKVAQEASPPARAPRTPAAEEPAAAGAKAGAGKEAPGTPILPRKIIRNGELQVVVKSYEPARRALEDLVRRLGGYISSSRVDHSLGQVSSATFVVRVPAGAFEALMARVARLGTVARESTSSQDITDTYYDLKARLTNAQKLEARLNELLTKHSGKISDLLEMEKEIARVRGEIERFEGKLRLYDNLVDLSTLTITLAIEEKYIPPRPPSLGHDARSVLRDSWDALGTFGRGLLLAGVALVPWALPLVLLGWLSVRWWRKHKIKREAAKAAKLAALASSTDKK